ncbi:MAG: rod-binding protein [Planctomycetes bacterium]|jgi:Rod binding domain-containing protein|nr:rod-binding protein [Planctomycetota bacterium]
MSDLAITAAGRIDRRAPAETQLRQVARQFEAVFVRELMKPLEQADEGEGGLFDDSQASQQYRGLFHGALSEQAAGGIGVADTLVRELSLHRAAVRTTPEVKP